MSRKDSVPCPVDGCSRRARWGIWVCAPHLGEAPDVLRMTLMDAVKRQEPEKARDMSEAIVRSLRAHKRRDSGTR